MAYLHLLANLRALLVCLGVSVAVAVLAYLLDIFFEVLDLEGEALIV